MTRLSNKNQYGSETGSSYNPISEEGNGNIAENNPLSIIHCRKLSTCVFT